MSQEFADAIQDETITHDDPTDGAPPEHDDTYEELIEHELTEDDKAHKRERLETVDREIIRLEEEKKGAAKVFVSQIKPLQAERDSILQALDQGTEKRQTRVYERFDDRLGKVEVRRVDTDEIVEERAQTQQERDEAAERAQGKLFDDSDGGGSVPPPAIIDGEFPEVGEGDDFEPTPEALAQAAVDEERVVKISSKDAKAKRAAKKREAAAADGDAAE
jgi:hypothetical protein